MVKPFVIMVDIHKPLTLHTRGVFCASQTSHLILNSYLIKVSSSIVSILQ